MLLWVTVELGKGTGLDSQLNPGVADQDLARKSFASLESARAAIYFYFLSHVAEGERERERDFTSPGSPTSFQTTKWLPRLV